MQRLIRFVVVVIFGLWISLSQQPIMASASPNQPAAGDADRLFLVSANTGNDAGECGTVAQPCQSIQRAVDLTPVGLHSEIRVAQGVYTSGAENVVNIELFTPGKSISLIGGFVESNWETPSTNPALTVIDGQNARRGVRVWSLTGKDGNGNPSPPQLIVFRNFTVQNGLVNSPLPNIDWYPGGGLLCGNMSTDGKLAMEVTNAVFQNNRIVGRSGNGIVMGAGANFLLFCTATVKNSSFINNQITGGIAPDNTRGHQAIGGGLFSGRGSDIVGEQLTFTNNVITAGSGGEGFTPADGQRADALGAAASFQYNKAQLTKITATGNQATGGNANTIGGTASGGGLFFEFAEATITDSYFRNNLVQGGTSPNTGGVSGGGAFSETDSVIYMDRVIMLENKSYGGPGADGGNNEGGGDAGGGAIYMTKAAPNNRSEVTIENAILAGNEAVAGTGKNRWGGGGAVFIQNSQAVINHATIADNSVLNTMQGSAIAVLNYSNMGSSLTMNYSIVANHDSRDIFNNPRAPIVIQTTGDVGTINNTLFFNNTQDANTGSEVSHQPGFAESVIQVNNPINGDPLFVSSGGPTFDYRIMNGSAAIGAAQGSNMNRDVYNEGRPGADGTVDLGADEFNPILLGAEGRAASALVTWSTATELINGIDVYEVIYWTGQNADLVLADANARQVVLDNLDANTTYTVRIDAKDGQGTVVASSNTVAVTTLGGAGQFLIMLPLIER